MNFFDYDLTAGSRTPPQSAGSSEPAADPTLNEEVSQVVGQLGRLWGGFRKQSQSVFETARKDLSSVVAQAQKEMGKLSTEPVASSSKVTTDETEVHEGESATKETNDSSAETILTTNNETGDTEHHTLASAASPFQSFFSRVQSSLPPNISSTLEKSLPSSLRDTSGHLSVDFAQLKSTLTSEFQRVQGVTRAQAEEYVHKSEALLKDAGEFLKDAVKVVPPEGQEAVGTHTEVMFDGTDLVFMPPTVGSFGPSSRDFVSFDRKGKGRETAAQAQQRLAGTRAATMLAQLKRDPEMLKADPNAEEGVKEMYELWLKEEVSSKEAGMDNSVWTQRIKSVLDQSDDGKALKRTLDILVSSQMDAQTFWRRYFFRVHQIEKDEEKRKALLAASGSADDEEDFAWEEEDDEDDSTTPPSASQTKVKGKAGDSQASGSPGHLDPARMSTSTLQPGEKLPTMSSYPSSLVTSPTNTSPRESTDGYDVVSSASGNGTGSGKGVKTDKEKEVKLSAVEEKKKNVEEAEEDGDSDWE